MLFHVHEAPFLAIHIDADKVMLRCQLPVLPDKALEDLIIGILPVAGFMQGKSGFPG